MVVGSGTADVEQIAHGQSSVNSYVLRTLLISNLTFINASIITLDNLTIKQLDNMTISHKFISSMENA